MQQWMENVELNQSCFHSPTKKQNPASNEKITSEPQRLDASEQEFALSSQEHQKILNLRFLSTKLLAQYPAEKYTRNTVL